MRVCTMPNYRTRQAGQRTTIRASDVGRYVFCSRAWWLERVQGYASTNHAALARGTQKHDDHGRRVVRAAALSVMARISLLISLCATLLLIVLLLSK